MTNQKYVRQSVVYREGVGVVMGNLIIPELTTMGIENYPSGGGGGYNSDPCENSLYAPLT